MCWGVCKRHGWLMNVNTIGLVGSRLGYSHGGASWFCTSQSSDSSALANTPSQLSSLPSQPVPPSSSRERERERERARRRKLACVACDGPTLILWRRGRISASTRATSARAPRANVLDPICAGRMYIPDAPLPRLPRSACRLHVG